LPGPRRLVAHLFDGGILAVALTYPVVPWGEETIRFQVNAAHTEADIALVLEALAAFSREVCYEPRNLP
jgi:glycine C-acetyltransferase